MNEYASLSLLGMVRRTDVIQPETPFATYVYLDLNQTSNYVVAHVALRKQQATVSENGKGSKKVIKQYRKSFLVL